MRVQDAFDLKDSYGLDHDPGVILVLEPNPVQDPQALLRRRVRVSTPQGSVRRVTIDAVEDHGPTFSLFLKNLTRDDVPIGSLVDLG